MAGRKPKPLAQKLLHGNPGKRKLNLDEPQYSGKPVCPKWIPKLAKDEFIRVTTELDSLDMLKSTDQAALEAYCVAYARWRTAEAIVDKEGQTVNEPVTNKAGEIVGHKVRRHPATIIAKDERLSMLKAASLFGFDPSSRSRIQVPENPKDKVNEDDELDYIFAAPSTSSNPKIH